MVYRVVLAPEAAEDLRRLRATTRAEVRDAMVRHLRREPAKTSRTRIKRLCGALRPQFRLRVGDVRVFYDIEGHDAQVLAIVAKRDAKNWLRKAGKDE